MPAEPVSVAPEPLVEALRTIPADLDLEDTITWVITMMQARTRQVRSLMTALYQGDRAAAPLRKPPHRHFHQVVNDAIASVLTRFDDQLRVGSPTACWAIAAMAFASSMPLTDDPDEVARRVVPLLRSVLADRSPHLAAQRPYVEAIAREREVFRQEVASLVAMVNGAPS